MTEPLYKLSSCFFFLRGSRPACEVAFINYRIAMGKHIFLKFLPSRNIFYDISLSHKQKHVFVLVLIGRKVPQSAFCAWVYSCSDTINSS